MQALKLKFTHFVEIKNGTFKFQRNKKNTIK